MHVVRNPPFDAGLADALVSMWTDVTNAGGTVGFVAPVSEGDVRPVADAAFARVAAGDDDAVVAFDGDQAVGLGFLVGNGSPMFGHWASIKRLQRHPISRGRGIGAAVLRELEGAALDRGVARVVLTVRGGTGREAFYLAHGYDIDAWLPGRIRLGAEHVVGEYAMSKVLDPALAGDTAGPRLAVRRLDPDLPLPSYAHPGDAGLDLVARIDVELTPGERAVVPTGVAVALPAGCVGLVHPRSGLAARHGLGVVNAPGTIDAGYRGEIAVILVNHDPRETVHLARGERIAQLVVQRVETVRVVEVDTLEDTSRGAGGFGSTGR